MTRDYNIIVIGAGHAGCEAACAAAKMGSTVLLITMDMGKIAQMSCNPAMGGIAKGQIVREIDALGGYSGIVTDASTIQFRMLNLSKGPAMWSPRAQCDRHHFSLNWRYILEQIPNLHIWQGIVNEFVIDKNRVIGVKTELGAEFRAETTILTAGTFLNGKLFIGTKSSEGGRIGELSSYSLTEQLRQMGIVSHRMKTGTPMRIDSRSVDFSKLTKQEGDKFPERFSYLPNLSPIQMGLTQRCCHTGYTNLRAHNILRGGFEHSPLFSGRIEGIGPRYCPSIEDKLVTFSDRDSHQLFLEPEGWNTTECYLQGFSSSLPLEIQLNALKQVPGFENVIIFRAGYAVEYDYFSPLQLKSSLESKILNNLFFAGQVNGTTGYEEAAAQGLMAGINAHLKINEEPPFVLNRDQAYIGVLIDDLITKGVDEPYRMFTSRAEYRILLRQDNADERLTGLSFNIGLASESRYRIVKIKYCIVNELLKFCRDVSLAPDMVNEILVAKGSSPISQKRRISDLLSRTNVSLKDIFSTVPRETLSQLLVDYERGKGEFVDRILLDRATKILLLYVEEVLGGADPGSKSYFGEALDVAEELCDYPSCFDFLTGDESCNLPYLPDSKMGSSCHSGDISYIKDFAREVIRSVEIRVKYDGYIERERRMADKISRLEGVKIPEGFDYSRLSSISTEARQKLALHNPETISQASRIPGVSPSDISILLVYFGR